MDPMQASFESFGDQLGDTQYWKALSSEYGVTGAISGPTNHVHIATAPPMQMSDMDLDSFVATNAGSTTSGWPAPTAQTIYVVYMNPSTQLMLNGSEACAAHIGGYHTSTSVNGQDVAYAIVPRCPTMTHTADEEATMSASHEIAEATTDPFPQASGKMPGLVGYDDQHLAYEFFQQFNSENGDACEFFKDSFYQEAMPFNFWVQRTWSNAASLAGHSPCAPAPTIAYYNTTLLQPESIAVDLSRFGDSATFMTKGVHIPVGQTKTFPVGFYSDGPVGPWNVTAVDNGSPIAKPSTTPRTKVSIDKTSGQNGDIAYVTVTVNTAGTTKSELVTIISELSGIKHYYPILIGSE
jgi:hypothetical protein